MLLKNKISVSILWLLALFTGTASAGSHGPGNGSHMMGFGWGFFHGPYMALFWFIIAIVIGLIIIRMFWPR